MLVPKKVKHRKWHKPRRMNKGVASRTNTVAFGSFGLKATSHAWVSSRQIEAARRAMTRYIKRGGKVWIRVFPHTPVTKKPNEVRMGSGKGAVDHYVAKVQAGKIVFELDGVAEDVAKEAMRLAGRKLPVKTRFVVREGAGE